MSDDESERDGRDSRFGTGERGRSPQRARSRSRSRDRDRARSSGRSSDAGGGVGEADPPATLFVAEIPQGLQQGALETLCVKMEVRYTLEPCCCCQRPTPCAGAPEPSDAV